jgi:hypothetical protein
MPWFVGSFAEVAILWDVGGLASEDCADKNSGRESWLLIKLRGAIEWAKIRGKICQELLVGTSQIEEPVESILPLVLED